MFKYFNFPLFFLVVLGAGFTTSSPAVSYKPLQIPSELDQFSVLINEVLELIKIEELLPILLGYMQDPEVANLVKFLLSAEFQDLLVDFLSIDDFREIIAYLESKGYDVQFLSDALNSLLGSKHNTGYNVCKGCKGINGLLQELIDALPIEKLREFLKNKLECNPELAELYEVLNSEEFIAILRKIKENEKFLKLKESLEQHGIVFEDLLSLILGNTYKY